jgi:hypothetical protein
MSQKLLKGKGLFRGTLNFEEKLCADEKGDFAKPIFEIKSEFS